MKGMRLCKRCGRLYIDRDLVCPACYDIIGNEFVLRERRPVEPEQLWLPLAIEVGSRVSIPALSASDTVRDAGIVQSVGVNPLGQRVACVLCDSTGKTRNILCDKCLPL